MAKNTESNVRESMEAPVIINTKAKIEIPIVDNDYEDIKTRKNAKQCSCCGAWYINQKNNFFKTDSPLFQANGGYLPFCKTCSSRYVKLLTKLYSGNEEHAIEHFCQQADWAYEYEPLRVTKDMPVPAGGSRISLYASKKNLNVGGRKTYTDSLKQEYREKVNGNATDREELYPDMAKYDQTWMGTYTESDLNYLNNYYDSLDRDYKIVTENHRDYARKIAKASLAMDRAFGEMIDGVPGADIKYKNMKEAFDSLSKSAKFSESTRSVNDIGATSFSKVASMVESHNWIPEHVVYEKDQIDELIDYLSTITKSV